MFTLLSQVRRKCAIGYVSGSNLAKQQEQLSTPPVPVTSMFDFCFAENGLTAFRMGQPLVGNSFIEWLGEERYKQLVNFCLIYIAGLDVPVKRGTFVEFRCVVAFPLIWIVSWALGLGGLVGRFFRKWWGDRRVRRRFEGWWKEWTIFFCSLDTGRQGVRHFGETID